MLVRTKPGQTTLTFTPQIGRFDAQRQGQPDDGVLAGVVGALNGPGSSPADDEVLTMWRIPAGS